MSGPDAVTMPTLYQDAQFNWVLLGVACDQRSSSPVKDKNGNPLLVYQGVVPMGANGDSGGAIDIKKKFEFMLDRSALEGSLSLQQHDNSTILTFIVSANNFHRMFGVTQPVAQEIMVDYPATERLEEEFDFPTAEQASKIIKPDGRAAYVRVPPNRFIIDTLVENAACSNLHKGRHHI